MKSTHSHQAVFPPASRYIYLLIVSALLAYAAAFFYQGFPAMYTWEELFINYDGGFLRRGLLGQLLFWANRVIPISIGYLVLYTALFYVFLYIAHKKLVQVFDPTAVAFLFISPIIFLLPVTDRHVFGRKDVFIEVLLLCTAQVCANVLTREKPALYVHTLLISIFFMTGMLIHEMMFFYCPLFTVLLGVAYARQNKILQWLCITGVLFSVTLLLFSVIFVGDVGTRDAICASWRQYYPELTCNEALRFIGNLTARDAIGAFQWHTNAVTMGSVCLCAFLGGLPLFFLWKAYRPCEAIRELLSSSLVLRLAFWPAAVAPLVVLVINVDYGRYISAAYLCYLFFLYAVFSARPQTAAPWLNKLKEALSVSPRLRSAAYFVVILYGLSWRMIHWQPLGESYLYPGALFEVLSGVLCFFYHKLGLFLLFQ